MKALRRNGGRLLTVGLGILFVLGTIPANGEDGPPTKKKSKIMGAKKITGAKKVIGAKKLIPMEKKSPGVKKIQKMKTTPMIKQIPKIKQLPTVKKSPAKKSIKIKQSPKTIPSIKKIPGLKTLPGVKKSPGIKKFPGTKKFPGLKKSPGLKLPGLKKIPGKKPTFPGAKTLPGLSHWHPDWQHWHHHHYGHYGWGGYWGDPWLSRWDRYWQRRWRRRYPVLLVFGTTWWGLNRMGYQFGYLDYYNPYAGAPIVLGDGVSLDYSEALVAPAEDEEPQESPLFTRSRQMFMARNYGQALTDINAALKSSPQDAVMHEFRALVLFALGDYDAAAAPLNAILAIGPGWDWKTIRGLYPDKATYTAHLRALEKHVTDKPKDPAGHFVLGYHYTAMGHVSYAVAEFREVVAINPKDTVAQQMVTMLTKGESQDDPNEAEKEPPLPGGTTGATTIPSEKLEGNWMAKREKQTYNLILTRDDKFVWTYTDAAGSKTVLKGTYAVQNGALALQPDSGGVLLADVALSGDNQMKFRMVNDNDKDPGLTFTK